MRKVELDLDVASMAGLDAALVLEAVILFIANDEERVLSEGHLYSAITWDDLFARCKMLPQRRVKKAIDDLVKFRMIYIGNFNETKMDHTKWYAVTRGAYFLREDIYKYSNYAKRVNSLEKERCESK